MLTREAVTSAFALAEKIDATGMVLTPLQPSPLDSLVKASRQPGSITVQSGPGYIPDFEAIDYMANTPMGELGASQHDMTMDEIAPVVIEAVGNHISFAKNVVAPNVQELAEAVQASLADYAGSSLLGMEVIISEAPQLLSNPLLATAVAAYEETPYDPPVLGMRLPEQTATEIREIMSSGTGRLDKDVDEWLAMKGDGWLLTLWSKAFQQHQAAMTDRVPLTFQELLRDGADGIDNALGIFLIARKLYSASPLEGTEMPLPRYESLMVEYRNQAARHLVVELDRYKTDVQAGVLVKASTTNTITVNSEVYRLWIEKGGRNEVLYGNLLNKPVLGTVGSINERAGELLETWNTHSAYVASAEANRRHARTKEFLALHFHKQMMDETDETNVQNAQNVYQNFLDELETIRESEMGNLYMLCLRLVCKSRFARTSALDILEGIENAKRDNPQLDIREAAAISAAQYVGKWVASMFKVGVM